MFCCSKCFGDDFLTTIIIRESSSRGTCDFCKTENTGLINPELLNDYFQPLIDLYETSEDGEKISTLLKNEWMLFPLLDDDIALKLIQTIFQEAIKDFFIPKQNQDKGKILNWQEFKDELKHDNRYFPQKAPSYNI